MAAKVRARNRGHALLVPVAVSSAMRCVFDHLVVSAPSLDEGVRWIERTLGVSLGPGGQHASMGTHNRLLRLGESAFLEVIAIDPDARQPARPRWFGLDNNALTKVPRIAAWVARTDDLHAWSAETLASLGGVETITRGEREWWITIPTDGAPALDGAFPALIEWRRPRLSAAYDLRNSGCTLAAFEIRYPDPARVRALLARLGLVDVAQVLPGKPALRAVIHTPVGRCVLGEFD